MSTEVKQSPVLKGGEWLIKESSPFDVFAPENFSEEQIMIRDMCEQFLDKEVYPILDRIDALEPGLMKSLLRKAEELPSGDAPVINITEAASIKDAPRAVCIMPKQPEAYMRLNKYDFF